MKFQKTLIIPAVILIVAFAGVFSVLYKPDVVSIQVTEDFKHWVNTEPITYPGLKFAPRTYVVHCKLNQFFRICSTRQTVITQFLPDTNGLAVIHFEYVN